MATYASEAERARTRARQNLFWVWFDVLFAILNAGFALIGTAFWWLNASVAVFLVVMAFLMYSLVKRERALAVRWDALG